VAIPSPVKRFFEILGPGLITGASDDDPSGIGAYALAEAAQALRPFAGDGASCWRWASSGPGFSPYRS